jgi:hypothetical protein
MGRWLEVGNFLKYVINLGIQYENFVLLSIHEGLEAIS